MCQDDQKEGLNRRQRHPNPIHHPHSRFHHRPVHNRQYQIGSHNNLPPDRDDSFEIHRVDSPRKFRKLDKYYNFA